MTETISTDLVAPDPARSASGNGEEDSASAAPIRRTPGANRSPPTPRAAASRSASTPARPPRPVKPAPATPPHGTEQRQREGYFQTQLRAQATKPNIAVPATIGDLLKELGTYLPAAQTAAVHRAYCFAEAAHIGQLRRTGHDYITHPLAVASILAAMRMDHQSIMAAVMHDVIEDTEVTRGSLAKAFGEEVAGIVDGVSKLETIFQSRAEAQAENFQKMAMAMARDLRVILVKLADRLHNMRTIGVMAPERRRQIARETLEFYAPIANRLGMNTVRVEFEDLAFQALYPLRADRIGSAAARARRDREAARDDLRDAIAANLRREGMDATVTSRWRHLYSIYTKMKEERLRFADLMDVFQFRVVVDRADTCYRALGVIHNLYKPVAARFKDYIAIPKANGYQSLHTTVVGRHGAAIEVQILTRQMDTVAEKGIAGAWLYQDNQAARGSHVRTRRWVAGILDLQRRAGNSLEFIESLKIDLFPDEVYVFTPKGDILELPKGATPIDFAYAIHTDVGNRCVACRVDRVLSALSAPLESGQTVDIITSPDGRPTPHWLTFAVSSRARSAIRLALKSQQRSESVRFGRRLLNRSLANAGTSIKALDFRRLRRVFRDFGVRKLDDLLADIGIGNLMAYTVAQRLLVADNPDYEAVDIEREGPVAIGGGDGLVITYGRCCGPVPGDHAVGHMTPGRGLVVHVETCNNVAMARRRNPRDIIQTRWAKHPEGHFDTTLAITVNRPKGAVAALATAVNAVDAAIQNITVDERGADLYTVELALSVTDRMHLARARQRLLAIPGVQRVERPIR